MGFLSVQKMEIVSNEDFKICPECNSLYEKNSLLCNECETNLVEAHKCPDCGEFSQRNEDTIYCESCGYDYSFRDMSAAWAEKSLRETPVFSIDSPWEIVPDWAERFVPYPRQLLYFLASYGVWALLIVLAVLLREHIGLGRWTRSNVITLLFLFVLIPVNRWRALKYIEQRIARLKEEQQ